jgi:LPXTG-motif cell wall-anchored protein
MAAIALAASATAWGQSGASFTATGQDCSQVTWSAESLAKYPKIASACQSVLQKDGSYYVKFSGEVKKVQNRGADLTVQFKDGNRVVLHPDPNFTVSINGKATKPSGLRPGDQLNFYIPQSRLVAQLDETPSATPVEEVRMDPAPAEEPAPAMAQELPKTASPLPTFGLIGLALLALGAALTAYRLNRRSS